MIFRYFENFFRLMFQTQDEENHWNLSLRIDSGGQQVQHCCFIIYEIHNVSDRWNLTFDLDNWDHEGSPSGVPETVVNSSFRWNWNFQVLADLLIEKSPNYNLCHKMTYRVEGVSRVLIGLWSHESVKNISMSFFHQKHWFQTMGYPKLGVGTWLRAITLSRNPTLTHPTPSRLAENKPSRKVGFLICF